MSKIFTKFFHLVCLLCVFSVVAYAQTRQITGTVVDRQTKEPLPGVSIVIKGTQVGTSTDDKGSFTLSVGSRGSFVLVASYVGYSSSETSVTGSATQINFDLEPAVVLGNEVVISASRTPERILESPVSVERMSAATIKELPSPSFYDALLNVKGVEMSAQSLTFKSVNTRGFNSNGNSRFNQFIDGMDNQAPGLNFAVGNIVGITELDVESVELLPGASSALYGAGGMNGTLLMNSKDPFRYGGASFQFKTGINHVDDPSSKVQPFQQFDMRIARGWNNKFGAKFAFSFLQAKDWIADNYSNYDRVGHMVKDGNRQTDPNFDGINIYGDEVSQNMRNVAQSVLAAGTQGYIKQYSDATGGMVPTQTQINTFLSTNAQTKPFYAGLNTPGLLPNQNVSRTGYDEQYLVDYDTKSLKLSGGLYYNLTNTIQLVGQANWGTGTTVYTGSDRYALRNFNIGLYKLELKGEDFYLRAYTTQERSGDSYVASILGSYINESTKGSTAWYPEYVGNYVGMRAAGKSDADAHTYARSVADNNRAMPGTPAFNMAKDRITNTLISDTDMGKGVYGSKFNERTNLYHYEGMYNLSNALNNVVELQVGASSRVFRLNSGGTLFDDKNRKIDIDEYGAFGSLGKKFGELFKLTVAGRYDKSQNFEGRFTPRVTGVFTVAKNNNIRLSYQTGFRNPTTQNQYIDLSVGGGSQRLIGGLPEMLNKYNLIGTNIPYTEDSYRAYLNALATNQSTANVLQKHNFDPKGVRPESVQSFELGYKGLILPNLLVDAYGYYNIYEDFITAVNVYQQNGSAFVKYGVPVNATGKVKSYGGAFGLDYILGNYTITANTSYNQLDELPSNFVNDFNTPKMRYNFGLANREIIKNVGFNVNYRWQDKFMWASSFAVGQVPAFATMDAQVNLKVPSLNSVIKLGGSNILNKYYITSYGNPSVGAMYYLSYTFNP